MSCLDLLACNFEQSVDRRSYNEITLGAVSLPVEPGAAYLQAALGVTHVSGYRSLTPSRQLDTVVTES